MATITTGGSGNWSSTTPNAPWPGGTLPTSADDVIAANGHTLTLDTLTAECLTLTFQSGSTFRVSTSVNSALKPQRDVAFQSGSTIDVDLSAYPAINCILYGNGLANGSAVYRWIINDGVVAGRFQGAPRKRRTRLSGAVSAGATSFNVDDASGWAVGDQIVLANTDAWVNTATSGPRHEKRTISAVSGTSLTISAALTYAHADDGYVINLTSNLKFSSWDTSAFSRASGVLNNIGNVSPANSRLFRDVEFRDLGQNFNVAALSNNYLNFHRTKVMEGADAGVKNCTFNGSWTYANQHLGGTDGYIHYFDDEDNVYHTERASSWQRAISIDNGMLAAKPIKRSTILRVSNHPAISTPLFANTEFEDLVVSGADQVWINTGSARVVGGSLFGNAVVCYSGKDVRFTDVAIGTEFGATNGSAFIQRGSGNIVMTGGSIQATVLDSFSDTMAPSDSVSLVNKGGNPGEQEIYTNQSTSVPAIRRDNAVFNRSLASLKFTLNRATDPADYEFQILAKNGEPLRLLFFVQKSASPAYGSSTLPSITVSGLGITPVVAAMSSGTAAGAWELLELNVTQNSGGDGLLTVTLSAQSATAGAYALFSGCPMPPFVTRCRHYGYLFDETIPIRTVDPLVDDDEATAAAITGISFDWDVSQTDTTISSNRTFQELYDHHQSQAVLNVGDAVALTGAGVAGSPALFAAGDVTVSSAVLNGSGSLAMGAHDLSANLNGGQAYTYTGGAYSRLTTLDTFTGGTLNIGAAGTYVFALSEGVLSMSPSAPGTYALGGCAFSGTIELVNTTAHAITVELPSGTSYVNTGPNITVETPATTRGLQFTNLVAGSQVVVCETGTQTEKFRTNNSGTSATWSEAESGSLTVDYTIMKAGYRPIRVTGVTVTGAVSGGVQTVQAQQQIDRAYVASSGLTWGTTATVNAGTKAVTLGAASTVQNWYSFMVESWIAQAALVNTAFPFSTNGPNSFTLGDGWVWGNGATSIAYLSRDGMRYVDASGNVTAMWAAILSVGVPSGMQVRYQQQDGSGTTNAAATGNIDQLIQILSDPNGDGNFADGYDRRGHLVLKVQAEEFDEAEFDAVATYGNLEDQFYVAGLSPTANGIAAGGTYTGLTLTDHGASPVTWNSKVFSLTITDTADARSGTEILQWIRNSNNFNYGDLVRTNGDKFRTVRGAVYGDTGAALKGVRVVKADGTTPHPDFNLFTADDGTTYTPPVTAPVTWAAVDGTTVLLYNDSDGGALIDTVTGTSGGYSKVFSLPHADVAIGDQLRLRHGNKQYYAGELLGVMTAEGLTFVGSQTLHPVYATWGLDGADYDQANGGPFAMDGSNIDVDIVGGVGSGEKKHLGAWTQYLMTLPAGLAAFYRGWDLLSPNAIRQNVDVVDAKLHKVSAGHYQFTDNNVAYYRSDFSLPYDTSGSSIFMHYDASPFVVTTSNQAVNQATVLAALTAQGLTTARAGYLDNLDAAVSTRLATAGYTAPPSAAAVRTEIDANSTKLDVAVGTRLAAGDYTAPDNAGIAAIPTNPLLTNDARLDNLDATVSSRLAAAGYTAPDNATVSSIASKVTEMHELEGLDATKPLVVTETTRTAGSIEQSITEAGGEVTVQRV